MVRTAIVAGALLGLLGMSSGARALDAGPWDAVLRKHARGGGVDYGALARDRQARDRLDAFLEKAETMPASAPLSAWLNVYNALVVRAVVRRYPLRSVRAVDGFFERKVHRVAGRMRSLDDLENRIIRRRFPDARVHAALNCGARSCPALHPRAFREATLDATLDRIAVAMVASPRHVRVSGDGVRVSRIFEWYRADFEREAGSILAWLREHDRRGRLASVKPNAEVAFLPYDWSLNDVPGGSR